MFMAEKLPSAQGGLKKIVVVLGPTASGKTDLGIFLAKKFSGEAINADSRQIYADMDIGTAKPAPQRTANPFAFPLWKGEKRNARREDAYVVDGVPHHLIDVVRPDEEFTVGDFKKISEEKIADILKRGKLPIIVGGTGLYIWALVDNLAMPQKTVDAELREKLNNTPLAELLKMLKEKDPDSYDNIDLKNPRRVIRALEVAISGESFWQKRKVGKQLYDVLQIGISWPREVLYERINWRVDEQIKAGLLDEVGGLTKKYGWEINAMNGIGYRQFKEYLGGKETLEEAVEKLKKDTRHYAKRQETWFKRDKKIIWLQGQDKTEAERLAREFLN